jgi:hydroxymethylpyrimidine pyrophosphatase-like HAD family hydrolase
VDAIVAENGAVGLVHKNGLPLSKLYQQDTPTRISNFARMQQVLAKIEQTVPGAQRSQDSAGRETDIAIDHSEFTHLPQAAMDRVVRIMQTEGMTATVSSIHINGWFGQHSKLTGARWIVRQLWGRDLDAEMDRWVYVGDSTNDQVMFERFANSVGVANIRRFEAQLAHAPRYITPSERGEGFSELAQHLLRQLVEG